MSCLFDSLSRFIPNTTSSGLRQKIVEFLNTDPILVDNVRFSSMMEWDSETAQDYIRRMKNENEWGGGVEIRAFCKLYNCRVIVHIAHTNRVVEFLGDDEQNLATHHILWTGNHFEPMC